jgi:hypothetical protein
MGSAARERDGFHLIAVSGRVARHAPRLIVRLPAGFSISSAMLWLRPAPRA